MKGGQKTIGVLYREAVEQLKKAYFQLVGQCGVVIAVTTALSSVFYYLFFFVYMLFIFGLLFPMMAVPIAGISSVNGDTAAGVTAILSFLLGMLVVTLVVCFIVTVVVSAVTIVSGMVQVSIQEAVLLLVKGDNSSWQIVWSSFKRNWKRYIGISAWSYLWTFLWSLLFIVPGVIKSFSYMLAPYLVIQYPDMTIKQALKKSIEITDGYKGRLFGVYMVMYGFTVAASFVASILIMFQFAVLLLWIYPLYFVMLSKAYLDIKQAAIEKGLLPPDPAPEKPAPLEWRLDSIPVSPDAFKAVFNPKQDTEL